MHRLASTFRVLAAVILAAGSLHGFDLWQEFPQTGTRANLWSVAFGGRTLVAVGEAGTIVVHRYDTSVWVPADSGTAVWLVGAGFGQGRFVVVGDRGTILTSDDAGGTWTPRVSGLTTRLNAVAYGGGRWVAVGEEGTVLTSPDGTAWTRRPALGAGFLRALAYGRGRFLLGGAGGMLFTSTDGETFTRVPLATSADIEGAAIVPDRYFVVGSEGLRASATELDAWQVAPPAGPATFRGVAVRNETEASAVGEATASTFIARSLSWVGPAGNFGLFGTAVAQGENELVAVGFDGRIARSAMASAPPLVASPGRTAIFGHEIRLGLRSPVPVRSYQWTRNGVDIPGATQPELVFPRASPADTGAYGLRFTTDLGASTLIGGTTFQVLPGGRPELRDPSFNAALPGAPTLVVPQPDGRLLVAGTFSVAPGGRPTYGLARLGLDGALDPSFRAGTGIPSGSSIAELRPLSDGRLYVRGSFNRIADEPRPGLARLLPDGSIDPSFQPVPEAASPTQLAPASDGTLYLERAGATGAATIVRVTATGALDPGFPPFADHLLVAVDTEGRVLATRLGPGTREFRRILPDGRPDPTYTNSTVPYEQGVTFSRYVTPARWTPHGLYAVQAFVSRFSRTYTLLRYRPDGGIDPAYRSQTFDSVVGADVIATHRPDGGFWVQRLGNFDTTSVESYSPDGLPEPDRYATLPDLSRYTVRAHTHDGSLIATQLTSPGVEKLVRIRPLRGAAGRLTNLSVRSFVGSGTAPLVVGFVTQGLNPTAALLRAIGPGLAPFDVPDRMPDPQLTLARDGTPIATSDDWDKVIAPQFAAVGAFALAEGSADAAFETLVGAGDHTFVAAPSGASGGGTVLAELYQTIAPGITGRRFVNLSARARVSPDRPHVAGFAIAGSLPLPILIRAAGPALSTFGVPDVLNDPKLTLYDASGAPIWENDSWDTGAAIAASVGAFRFDAGSRDAAAVVTLAPGTYTVQVSGAAGQSGEALVEVYVVP